MTQLHVHLHLLDCCRDHACQYGRHKILTYKFVCQALYETPCPVFFLLSDEKYGWNGCRASSLDAPGDAKRSRRIRTVDYSKPGGEAPFSVPAMSGLLHDYCVLPFQRCSPSALDPFFSLGAGQLCNLQQG